MLKYVKTKTKYEEYKYFMYEGLEYLRSYVVKDGVEDIFWYNTEDNMKLPNYTFDKWKNNLDLVKNLYNREIKLERILK